MKQIFESVSEQLEPKSTNDSASKNEVTEVARKMEKIEEINLETSALNDLVNDINKIQEDDFQNSFVSFEDENDLEFLRDMQDNRFYAIDISSDFYADFLLLQKEKDTLWVLSIVAKDDTSKAKNLLSNFEIADNQHCLMQYDAFKFLSYNLFPQVYLELYNAHMCNQVEKNEPALYVVQSDLKIHELSIKKLHELSKKSMDYKKDKEYCR